ncbi:aldo/keto reductase [Hymenobacter chitinivorans]|uniref:Aryl-alcohol dehydrogenase-like predicted oxidoreductase n=1 Tax=Hymenobacter chitinivorans DSM 11115 TaxID=1121954 RepID=A0A2M9BPM3_9BACT|nr:aldo/keto reductase [Hymenobacter chitinivorans]PJJ59901.1 aryl-alcohol dehydrogenase-like predicted oxidoreductase [Hymenobacter chitinivorans DSM 11115]
MSTIKQVALGSQGLEVPVEGLGCMGMTSGVNGMSVYGEADEVESEATIHRALELGVNLLDTADLYGPMVNERLVGRAIAGRRQDILLATKFGFEVDDQENWTGGYNGRPEYVRKSIERSLRNLGTDYVDLYYLHRIDPNTPLEDTVGAMSRLVEEGKVRFLGLSEVTAEELRRGHAVHPITALQTEYSLFDRGVEENGVLQATRDLGIGFVGYSPLGRGFLSGDIKTPDDFEASDSRRFFPRYQGENFYKNLALVEKLQSLAQAKGVTAAQLALAWVLAQGVVAIPGTKRRKYLEQNVAAASLALSEAELAELEAIMPVGSSVGAAYPEGF